MSDINQRPKALAILGDETLRGALPQGFMYGCATASYQIEGGWNSDNKAPNVWDTYLKKQDNGEIACDSYNLWQEDIKLLKEFGCNTYRFSVSWSRIIPLGGRNDPVNEAGIKYYSDLVDALIAEGITPFVTIYHWDLPQALQDRYGGFLNDTELVEDFVFYAKILFERLGDRVKLWATFNEPHIFTMLSSSSYLAKDWVHKRDHARLARSTLLCHARTVELFRKSYQSEGSKISLVLNCDWVEGVDDSKEAAEAAQFALDWVLGLYAGPVYQGKLPQSVVEYLGDLTPQFSEEEWKMLKGSGDFFGWNHYGTQLASGKRLTTDNPRLVSFGSIERVFKRDGKVIGNKGEAGHPYDVPWGFRKLTQYIHEHFTSPWDIPIIITECGFSIENESQMTFEERLHDTQRQDYYAGYLKELALAVKDDKIPVEGFMAWSLMDNLEWLYGYDKRFGITIVDSENGHKRHPKDSSKLLRSIFEHIMSK